MMSKRVKAKRGKTPHTNVHRSLNNCQECCRHQNNLTSASRNDDAHLRANLTSKSIFCGLCESMMEVAASDIDRRKISNDRFCNYANNEVVSGAVCETTLTVKSIPVRYKRSFHDENETCDLNDKQHCNSQDQHHYHKKLVKCPFKIPHPNNIGLIRRRLIIFLLILVYGFSVGATAAYWRTPFNNGEVIEIKALCEWAKKGNYLPHNVMCQKKPKLIEQIKSGLTDAVFYCERQFKLDRWNCSQEPLNYYTTLMNEYTKEKAFVQAMTSASIVHSIVRACARGDLPDCKCDNFHPDNKQFLLNEAFKRNTTFNTVELDHLATKLKLKECSDNIAYGFRHAETFLLPRKINRERYKLDVHNYMAGRQVITEGITRSCACHGVSGACTQQSCYDRIPSMKTIAEKLRKKYDESSVCWSGNIGSRISRCMGARSGRCNRGSRIVSKGGTAARKRRECRSIRNPPDSSLVYRQMSSNFCRRSTKRGVLGTVGRICNPNLSKWQPGSCKKLCCGRGYTEKTMAESTSCNCTFAAKAIGGSFSNVVCQKCPSKVKVARCK